MNKTLRFVLGLFICSSAALHAEGHMLLQITQSTDSALAIAVMTFKWAGSGSAPEDIGGIVAADLRNSGKFKPLTTSCLPQRKELGIDNVVVGKVKPNNDKSYMVSYQLINISGTHDIILAQNQYKVERKWLRYAAHTASDEVFEKLTGIKGAFRTRITYVVHNNMLQYPYELRVADYDGYNAITVHRSSTPLMSPAWSPDSSKLAYVTFENGCSELVIQTLDSGSIRSVASFSQHNGAPAFSPDGTKLAFALSKTGSLNLYLMDLDTSNIYQITKERSNNTEPTWFPDSQTLAYTSDQGGYPQVYKIHINGNPLNGNNPQRLSWEGVKNQNAVVSSNGKFLIMVSNNHGAQHIAKLNLATGTVQVLTNTFLDETPSIAPNGTMVIYSSVQGLASVLQLVSTDGVFKACLLETDGQVKFPAWSPYL